MDTPKTCFHVICLITFVSGVGNVLFAKPTATNDTQAVEIAALVQSVVHGNREQTLEGLAKLERCAIDKRLGSDKGDIIKLSGELIQSQDDDVAEAACDLACWLDADALPPLVAALESDNPNTQARAARALGAIASRDPSQREKMGAAIAPLGNLLDNGAKAARHNAFYTISELGPGAIPHMIGALDAEDYFITVMTKGFVRDGTASIEPLCKALRTGDVATRRNAAKVLFSIAWQTPDVSPALELTALGPLTEAISDDDYFVRSTVIRTLGRMEDRARQALEQIIGALRQDNAPYSTIADAVSRIGPQPQHLNELLQGAKRAAESPTESGRIPSQFGAAVGAVGKDGVESIVAALDDPDEIVRKTAMYALFHMGETAAPAVPVIIRKMNDGDKLAPQALGAIGPSAAEAVPHLIRRLAQDEWALPHISGVIMHRSSYADALAAIGTRALPALLRGMQDDNNLVKAGCLVALAEMESEAMVPLADIKSLTADEHPVIRGLALGALLKHGDKEAIEAILERLVKDPNPGVARLAQRHAAILKEGDREQRGAP